MGADAARQPANSIVVDPAFWIPEAPVAALRPRSEEGHGVEDVLRQHETMRLLCAPEDDIALAGIPHAGDEARVEIPVMLSIPASQDHAHVIPRMVVQRPLRV